MIRNFLFYLTILVIFICIFSIFIKKEENIETYAEPVIEEYDYGAYNEIRLMHVQTGEIETLNLDNYLVGVVAAEMPASFNEEALKAQSLVARTYTIYQIMNSNKHEGADLCDSSLCCQAWISKENRFARWEEDKQIEYWNKIVSAVNDTKGKFILYDGKPIDAFFHSNSGGKTELSSNVWQKDFPYLAIVETQGEEEYSSYESEMEFTKDELIKLMHEKYSKFEINFSKDDAIKITEFNESGRVKNLKVGNINLSGIEARKIFSLKSSKFTVSINDSKIIFKVNGYGHGVGLSQCGSDALAKTGMKAEDIIKYYYKNVEISE